MIQKELSKDELKIQRMSEVKIRLDRKIYLANNGYDIKKGFFNKNSAQEYIKKYNSDLLNRVTKQIEGIYKDRKNGDFCRSGLEEIYHKEVIVKSKWGPKIKLITIRRSEKELDRLYAKRIKDQIRFTYDLQKLSLKTIDMEYS